MITRVTSNSPTLYTHPRTMKITHWEPIRYLFNNCIVDGLVFLAVILDCKSPMGFSVSGRAPSLYTKSWCGVVAGGPHSHTGSLTRKGKASPLGSITPNRHPACTCMPYSPCSRIRVILCASCSLLHDPTTSLCPSVLQSSSVCHALCS